LFSLFYEYSNIKDEPTKETHFKTPMSYKTSSSKELHLIAEKLNIGDLTKFYKLKKPNKEDLNIVKILLLGNIKYQEFPVFYYVINNA